MSEQVKNKYTRPLLLKEKENYKRILGLDWSELAENYSDASIDKIIDKAGAMVTRRVTSYPTPLARMHFFEDAFQYIVDAEKIEKNSIYYEAVSHCLDVWEILFNYDVFKSKLNIYKWKYEAISELSDSENQGHRILGKSLNLFLQEDKSKQLNGTIDEIYLLDYDGHLFAGSSPYTGFFTIDFNRNDNGSLNLPFEIKIPGSATAKYFETIRSLNERDEDFQEYMFRLVKSHTLLADYFLSLYKYITKFVKKTVEIHRIESIKNPEHILLEYLSKITDIEHKEKKVYIPNYKNIEIGNGDNIILLNKLTFKDGGSVQYKDKNHFLEKQVGIFAKKREIGIKFDCDFIIDINVADETNEALKKQKEELKNAKVLALRKKPDDKQKKYIGSAWDNSTNVEHYNPLEFTIDSKLNKRTIPSWNINHPYVVLSDFLEEYLIEVPYNINDKAFHTCKLVDSKYLLPIKPLYFNIFIKII